MSQSKIDELLSNIDDCYMKFYENDIFNGPSLYFHKRCLEVPNSELEKKCELLYAMLPSWGMHRMGPRGPKVVEYEVLLNWITTNKEKIEAIGKLTIDSVFSGNVIKDLFCKMKVMQNERQIVGNSKVLAHLFPKLFGPIDNQYTLKFAGVNEIPTSIEEQYILFERVTKDIYYQVVSDSRFIKYFKEKAISRWDTSELKKCDNIIIGYGIINN